jgi:Flp pilus assembly protein TadD
MIGAPASEADRRAATIAFARGQTHRARFEWERAEAAFHEALLLDGSVAAYHAALGAVLVVLERGAEAEAAYSAALLLDPENVEYRAGLLDARRIP